MSADHKARGGVSEAEVGPSLWLEHRANGSYLVRRSGDVSACLAMLSKEEAAALEAAAQARAGQDHGGEAGEVERLRALLAQPERQPMGFHERHAVLHARAVAAEARAAKAVERIKALEEALRPFAKAGELFRPRGPDDYDLVVYKPAAGPAYEIYGDHLRAASTLLSDHLAPEPGVEAGEVGKCKAPGGVCLYLGQCNTNRYGCHDGPQMAADRAAAIRALQTPANGGRDAS